MAKETFREQAYRLYQAYGGTAGPDSLEFGDWLMAKARQVMKELKQRSPS